MVIKVPIELEQKGAGVKTSILGLQELEKQAKRTNTATKEMSQGLTSGTARAGQFADSVGRTSTALARSADAFGLPTQALRTLDDVMDVAEMGLGNLSKSAAGFTAASVGVAGAGLAIGYAFGSWLNTFPAVQKAADSLFHSMFRFVGLAPEITASAGPIAEFSKKMAAANADAMRKQAAALRAGGLSSKELAEFFGVKAGPAGKTDFGRLTPELAKELGLTKEILKADEKRLAAAKKQKEELRQLIDLMSGPKFNPAGALKVDFAKDLMGGGMATSLALSESRTSVSAKPADVLGALMGSPIAKSLNLSWSKEQDINREGEARAAAAAAENTQKLIGTFDALASQLSNLSQSVGGFAGKLLGIASSLSSGAGGIFSGVSAFKDAGKTTGILGTLGKFSAGLGIVGSAVGAIGGLVGGIKSLLGGKSKEEKAAEAAAKKQAEEDRKAAVEAAKQARIEGLKSAQAAAESLMDRMAKGGMSEGLTAALGTLVGKVQEALLKSGLGFMATPGLRESKEFMGAQQTASDVAQLLAGLREGGALDAGVMAAAGQSATELQAEAVKAAEAAGMAPAEATRAGFGAIAPLLREQLNASLASGVELDANTKALIEEAKKNGISIVADPIVESVSVQKSMLGELKRLNGAGGGVPDESFASGTKGLRLVKRDMLARIHAGEGMLVVPKEEMSGLSFRSFARGTEEGGEPYEGRGVDLGGGTGGGIPVPTSPAGTTGGESTQTAEANVEAAVRRAVSKVKAVQVTNAPTVQIVDNSQVRTVEGQKRFERETVGAITRALEQSNAGLESQIRRIIRSEAA